MAQDKFVDTNLVKIRDKISETASTYKERSVQNESKNDNSSESVSKSKGKSIQGTAVVNERDWKKAVFRRWDEFKNIKKDIVNRLAERVASIPNEISESESNAEELKQVGEKYKKLLREIDELDDSTWNRHNFTAELASGMKKLENARIEFMMLSSKYSNRITGTTMIENKGSDSFIHELNSLSFKQCFRVGLFFFTPLILGILAAVILWGLIFYFSTH